MTSQEICLVLIRTGFDRSKTRLAGTTTRRSILYMNAILNYIPKHPGSIATKKLLELDIMAIGNNLVNNVQRGRTQWLLRGIAGNEAMEMAVKTCA